MLWFDNDPKTTLQAKIISAADHYRHKYGRVPDMCFVPVTNQPMQIGRLTVKPWRSVMPHHLWIGCEENSIQQEGINHG
jgi:hypothetical protein